MYKLVAGISLLIRQFCVPNPFEPRSDALLLNIIAEPIMHIVTYGVVGIFYEKYSAPAVGSFLYLLFYCIHTGLLMLDDQALQTKITEYETKVATLTAENEKLKVDGALKVALLDAGAKASDLDYLMFKAGTGDRDLKIGEDGKLKGQDDLIAGLKTQFPGNFATTTQRQVQEHKIEQGSEGGAGGSNEPKTLAEALKMQYESKE